MRAQRKDPSANANANVYVVAPSSVLDPIALKQGLRVLKEWTGAPVALDPAWRRRELFFAGSDQDRAQALERAFWESPAQHVIAARGGYGAGHLLPYLEQMERRRGRPPQWKVFWGCSDSTALLQWVRDRWKWEVVHSPMPGLRFDALSASESSEWQKLFQALTHRERVQQEFLLHPLSKARASVLRAPVLATGLQGGNLSVLCSLLGTAYEPRAWKGQVLFLEDVSETWSRVDRMVEHLTQWALHRRQAPSAVVLGNFLACEDRVPPSASGKALRAKVSDRVAIEKIFGRLGERLNCPVWNGLPVGHGPDRMPLSFAQGRGRVQIEPILSGRAKLSIR